MHGISVRESTRGRNQFRPGRVIRERAPPAATQKRNNTQSQLYPHRIKSVERGTARSTAAVQRMMTDEMDLSRKRRAEMVDKVAAAYILQGALDIMRAPGR